MSRVVLIASCLVLALVRAPNAHASPFFPTSIQSDLGLNYAPDCLLCHNNESGGIGTVKTAFGKNMMARGLVDFSADSLQTALTLMDQQHVISAGGCLPDIEELKAGRDPNHPNDAATCGAGTGMPTMPTGTTDGGTSTAPMGNASSESESPPVAEYGCRGAAIARGNTRMDGAALFAAGLMASALLVRARKRRR